MIWAEMEEEVRVAAIVRLARDGNSAREIARVLGTSNASVSRLIQEYGVVIHSLGLSHPSPEQDDSGLACDDPHKQRLANWERARAGARMTLMSQWDVP